MCGIVMIAAFNKKGLNYFDTKVFENMLVCSTVRGKDGAGVIYVGDKDTGFHNKGQPWSSWVKLDGTASELMATKLYDEASNEFFKCRFLIGHTRWATKGRITTDNTHPFQEKHITMVHNGTIFNVLGMKDFDTFPVDSLALCHALARDKPQDVLGNIVGAAAMIWYDSKRHKLCVFRNDDRPLFAIVYDEKIYMASEAGMLQWLVQRDAKFGKVPEAISVDPHTLLEWDHTTLKPKATAIEQQVKVTWTSEGGHFPHWARPGFVIDQEIGQRELLPPPPDYTKEDKPIEPELVRARRMAEEEMEKEYQRASATTKQNSYSKMQEYWGVTKDKRIIFAPGKLDTHGSMHRLEGAFEVGMDDPIFTSMLDKVRVLSMVKDGKYAEQLFKAEFVSARVINMTVNTDDVNDVRFYVTDPQIVDAKVYERHLEAAKRANQKRLH